MLTLKLSGVVVCLCNAEICHSISIIKFSLFFFGVECGHHKTTSGVDVVLVLVHALCSPWSMWQPNFDYEVL